MTSYQLINSISCSTVSTVMAEKPLHCLREHICNYYWQYSCFALQEAMTVNGTTSVLETGALRLQKCCTHAACIFWPNSSVLHSSDAYPHTSRCVHMQKILVHARPFVPSCSHAAACTHMVHICAICKCAALTAAHMQHAYCSYRFCKGS